MSRSRNQPHEPSRSFEVLAGGGVTGALIRSIDWANTVLGPIAHWPHSLITTIETILHSRHPMFLWWGPELIQFYNDAYLPSFGAGKHPAAMGQPGRECWREIWPIIGPQIEGVMSHGTPTWHEDALVAIHRNERMEEVYWTYGYSPVFGDDRRIGGTMVICTETTGRVLGVRRQQLLQRLAERTSLLEAVDLAVEAAMTCLADDTADVPFAVVLDRRGGLVTRSPGLSPHDAERLAALVRAAAPGGATQLEVAGGVQIGPWPEPVTQVFAAPLRHGGLVVFGLSARLSFDASYRDFLLGIVENIGFAQDRARALVEVERISRAKDEFVATMSHELRTPLNAILGWATMLRSSLGDDAKLARGLAVIERNAEAQARLISDLLDVSRIISGKLRLSVKRTEFASMVHAAVDVVRPAADAKGVALAMDLDPYTGALVADPDRLQQIVWNLLSNAVKFTRAGGTVTVTAKRVESRIQLSVIDTGAGIAREHLPVIFERFRQIDGSTTRAHGGLGLGLAIVRHLAEAHGGTVTAHSDGPDTGSTFVVELPVHAVATSEAQQLQRLGAREDAVASNARGVRLVGMHVLVVDDEEDSLDLLRMVLEEAGAAVTVATTARDALVCAARSQFDVVISDIGMPEADGYSFMRQLRGKATGGNVPAIALTAYARAEDTEQAFRAGYQEHLTKPVDIAALLATVERIRRL